MQASPGAILWLIFLVPLAIALIVGIAYWLSSTRRDARREQARGFDVVRGDEGAK